MPGVSPGEGGAESAGGGADGEEPDFVPEEG